MRQRTALLVLWSVVAASGCSGSGGTESSGGEPTRAERARSAFEQIGPDDPFCTAAVRRGDELVFAEAYGSDDDGPMTVDTEVDIASVSKQFTGVAIEMLIEDGDLAGSDVVADLVRASSPATDDITVDELLIHTSGLEDYTGLLPEDLDESTTQVDAIAAIGTSEPTGTRGSFDYSNSNYVLLAEVVEASSGRSLPELLEDEVFEPLELDMVLEPRGEWLQIGDGSIWTTPSELVAWSSQYWGQTLDTVDLVEAMFDPEVEAREEGDARTVWYGSGIMRTETEDGVEVLFHDGSWDGYETDWATIPDERLAAAVTCNEDAPLTSDTVAEDLLDIWRE